MTDIYSKFNSLNNYETLKDSLASRRVRTDADKLQSEKIERTFDLSDYKNSLKYYENTEAMARVILNLLYLKPGNYPNSPEMGINIKQYQFEFLDNSTISEIEANINEQIQTYLADSIIGYVEIKKLTTEEETIKRTIIIAITVSSSKGSDTYEYLL